MRSLIFRPFSFILPLTGGIFYTAPHGRHVAAKLRNLTFRPFSFILPLTGGIFYTAPHGRRVVAKLHSLIFRPFSFILPLTGEIFLYRTPRQACGGEIAQLNIPAVFFHPPLDGRDFFIPLRDRRVVAKLRSLIFRPFSFILSLTGGIFLYRTPRQACGGEIAQLNIPAVFFHPPLDGRDFFIPLRDRRVVAKLRSLIFRPFSFILSLTGGIFLYRTPRQACG